MLEDLEVIYKRLAARLDALPNGFPPTEDGVELRLLEKLFTPEQAALACCLSAGPEPIPTIAARASEAPGEVRKRLKDMVRAGLISSAKTAEGLGFALRPFVVGIYEMQVHDIDEELAQLFEEYYQRAFAQMVRVEPEFHRVIPVMETVRRDMEIQPFESVTGIVHQARAWAVMDCICRKQKALVGDACEHPLEVCMIMSPVAGAFTDRPGLRDLSEQEALDLLHSAAEAGLVHSVSNTKEGVNYICNCCTCACGILRGMSEFGMANVVARSPFVNQVDENLCTGCGLCIDECSFGAVELTSIAVVDDTRCVGCGVCTLACAEAAMALVRRPADEIAPTPLDEKAWGDLRAAARAGRFT